MTASVGEQEVEAGISPSWTYAPVSGVYDEMMDASGAVRPAWRPLVSRFSNMSEAVLSDRALKTEHLLFENFSDPQEGGPPWRLDVAPLMLGEQEWVRIEAAALQRARLYNALIADAYGPQRLFTNGVVPPDVVLNDPSFLRPLHGVTPPNGHLSMLALDLARDPSGDWRVIDAHAETPAGHGYVLANRMMMAEVSGDLFSSCRAYRIGQFYQAFADSLVARAQSDDPTIALLTSAPGEPAYLGHAYMGRYLGYMRVEGSDLRVADKRLYLKTIDGLKRVDLLLRGVEGRRCDPLELAPDGFQGPAGLVSAVRENADLVANALGASIVENRGLSPFLPGVARELLGEDLLMPDPPRHWLGEPGVRDHVLSKLDDFVIHDAHEGIGRPGEAQAGQRAASMDPDSRAALVENVGLRGGRLVAERPVGFATAPHWGANGLAPAPYALRVFVAALDGGFAVMPGGVALTIDADSAVAVTSQTALSRDVWVAGPNPPPPAISLKRIVRENAVAPRQSQELQSRAADNLFWLGRYCERAESLLRILRQTLTQTAADLAPISRRRHPLAPLQHLLMKDEAETDEQLMLRRRLCDAIDELSAAPGRLHGLPNTIDNIKRTALQCRERLSIDSWRILTSLSTRGLASQPPTLRDINGANGRGSHGLEDVLAESAPSNALDIVENCDALLEQLAAFAGMTHENMTRNRGWRFLDMGRRLERAAQLSELLHALFADAAPDEEIGDDMTFALYVADSYLTFRSRYRFAPDLKLMLDLLLIDETNPRSVAYQLSRLSEHIGQLPKSAGDAHRAPDQRLALDLLTQVRLADLDQLAAVSEEGRREELAELLGAVFAELPHLSELVSRQYFSLADEQPRRLQSQTRS
ncbi:MAG: circularly permuted type 2 ATP-grasp protein [Pseudomonadota bacterium]